MSKKGENIYKRKDGRWEGRYIRCYDENGKAKYGYIYGKTYNETKQKLILKKSDTGKQFENLSNSTTLYNEILDSWLQSVRINVKESTYARYSHLIDTHVRTHLGQYQITKISTQLVERFIKNQLSNGRLKDGSALSSKTVIDILTIFGHTVPRAMLPDSISMGSIKSAMKTCIENKKDTLFELLGVELNDEYLY